MQNLHITNFHGSDASRCIHLPHLDLLSGHTGTQGLHFLRATRLRHMRRNFEQMLIKAGKVLKLWVFKHPSLVGNVHRVGMLKHWCVPSDFSCQPQNTHLPSIVNSKGTGTSHPAPGPRPVGAPSNHCQFWRSLFRAKKTHK